jgi:hypothetical protein
MANKYKNIKDERNGIKFDSKKEAIRYDELMLLQKAGQIRDLKLQPTFTLQEAFTTPGGEHIRAITYRADFSYEAFENVFGVNIPYRVVEDCKGFRTKEYALKAKIMADKGVVIKEI